LLCSAEIADFRLRPQIRTPLNAVQGATALLQDTAPLSGEQRELLALLEAGANHVVVIVNDSAWRLRARAVRCALLAVVPVSAARHRI
jgi:signal transduction histidine kinase